MGIEEHEPGDQSSIIQKMVRTWRSSHPWVMVYTLFSLLPVGFNIGFVLLMILAVSDRLFSGSGTGNSGTPTTILVMVIITIAHLTLTLAGIWVILRFSNMQKWPAYLRISLSTLAMIGIVAIGIAILVGLITLGFFAAVSDNY